MKLSICLCIRNGEKYIQYLNYVSSQLKSMFNVEYYIYENNSTDHTKEEIINFAKTNPCKYLLEDIPNNHKLSGINNERGTHMATIRNKLKDFHGLLTSDYTLLIDDVVFLPETIQKLLATFDPTMAMVSTYCICWNYYKMTQSLHYYDTFAVITNNNISYKENNNTCCFKSCKQCFSTRPIKTNLFDDNKLISVKSAFGSLSMIKTTIYNKVRWGNSICEHHSFCQQIQSYGKIIINPTIKIIVSNDDTNYLFIHNQLKSMYTKRNNLNHMTLWK